MDRTLTRLPDSELAIMKVIWDKQPVTRLEIQKSAANGVWQTATVQSLLGRLEAKGFVGHEQRGKTFFYFPLVERDDYLRVESRTALGRMFRGSPTELIAALHRTDSLSSADIDELYAYLEKLKKEETP